MDWRDTFQNLRRGNEKPSLGLHLFKRGHWLLGQTGATETSENMGDTIGQTLPEAAKVVATSERIDTISSLKEFAEKEMEKQGLPTGTIAFDGGELTVKEEQNDQVNVAAQFSLSRPYPDSEADKLSKTFKAESKGTNPQVVIISERPKDWGEDGSESLLTRMIQAMKLESESLSLGFVEKHNLPFEENEELQFLMHDLASLTPKIVITMGAMATNYLLNRKERLSKVHGEFFDCSVSFSDNRLFEFKLVPVFHPDILLINPNMKRSAWMDLQKVLKYLGKEV